MFCGASTVFWKCQLEDQNFLLKTFSTAVILNTTMNATTKITKMTKNIEYDNEWNNNKNSKVFEQTGDL